MTTDYSVTLNAALYATTMGTLDKAYLALAHEAALISPLARTTDTCPAVPAYFAETLDEIRQAMTSIHVVQTALRAVPTTAPIGV